MPVPIIELPTHCDRSAAASLHPEFIEAMGSEPIVVDASRVERLGLAVLQLLVSAERTTGGLAIQCPSAQLRETLALAGLEEMLASGDRV